MSLSLECGSERKHFAATQTEVDSVNCQHTQAEVCTEDCRVTAELNDMFK